MRALQAKLPPYIIGALAKRKQRVDKVKAIKKLAISEIGNINFEEFKMLGTMLYWCEGSKEREKSVGQRVEFVNSDPLMCKFFLKWLNEILEIENDRLDLSIYISESKKPSIGLYIKKWAEIINLETSILKVYFTKDRWSKNKRSNDNYIGQLRIRVRKSTDLNRKISGWIDGICTQLGIFGD